MLRKCGKTVQKFQSFRKFLPLVATISIRTRDTSKKIAAQARTLLQFINTPLKLIYCLEGSTCLFINTPFILLAENHW